MSAKFVIPRRSWWDQDTVKIFENKAYIRKRIARIQQPYTFDTNSANKAIMDWIKSTEQGQWYAENAKEVTFLDTLDMYTFEKVIWLSGYVTDEDWCWFILKWGAPRG